MSATAPSPPHAPVLRGLLLEFDSPGALITAAEQVRDAGYTRWDTYSPYPVHGIDAAMGIRATRLPWVVLIMGLMGCAIGLGLEWWTNATDVRQFPWAPVNFQGYAFHISGKPVFSLPANIPVVFEFTVLLAALGAVVGMLAMNNLPRHHRPVFAVPRFRHVTRDRFFLCISAADPLFDPNRTREFLTGVGGTGPEPVEEVDASAAGSKLPRGLTIAGVIIVCLALLPPLVAAKARVSLSQTPRFNIVADMDKQERYKTQQAHPLFADGRAMRPQVAGTVARGDLHDDTHFYTGKIDGEFASTFPPQVRIDAAFLRRGQQRFNIYCAPCHGLGGAGDGVVAQRALNLGTTGWVQPTSLLDPTVLERPHGHIFNTITNGIRTMPPYGDQIPEADRWAIIAYVRALERSQNARLEDVPAELRSELR
jgi:mono/diheme cytochrome c family protein